MLTYVCLHLVELYLNCYLRYPELTCLCPWVVEDHCENQKTGRYYPPIGPHLLLHVKLHLCTF